MVKSEGLSPVPDSMSSTKYKTLYKIHSLRVMTTQCSLLENTASGPDFPETLGWAPPVCGLLGPRLLLSAQLYPWPSHSAQHLRDTLSQSLKLPLTAALLPPVSGTSSSALCSPQLCSRNQTSTRADSTREDLWLHADRWSSTTKNCLFTLRLFFVIYTYKSQ